MKLDLERIELREIELPLKYPFETSFGRTTRRRIMIVRAFDKSGRSAMANAQRPKTRSSITKRLILAWLIVTEYIAPLLASARVASAEEVNEALGRIRGNRMAKGGIETAIWDLEARLANKPLWQHLGGTRAEIACGVSIGLQESTSSAAGKSDARSRERLPAHQDQDQTGPRR